MEVILFRILLYNLAWTSYGSLKESLFFFLEDSDVSSNFLSALVILVTSFVEILNIRVQIHWSDVGTMPFFRREEFGRSLALYI